MNPYWGLLVGILIVLFLNGLLVPTLTGRQIKSTDYGTFIAKVDSGLVKDVVIESGQIYFTTQEGNKTSAYQTGAINDPQLVDRLLEAKSPNEDGKISFNQVIPQENSPLLNFVLMWVLPGLIFILFGDKLAKPFKHAWVVEVIISCPLVKVVPRFMPIRM